MPNIRIRVTLGPEGGPTLAEIVQRIVDAVKEELRIEMAKLARDATRVWRKAVPYVTGRLRRSCIAVDIRGTDRYGVRFAVVPPGNRYYDDVARLPKYRHRHLRNLQIVRRWVDAHIHEYADRAIDRALARTA